MKKVLALVTAALFAACSGSSDSTDPTPPTPTAPVLAVVAGAPSGASVELTIVAADDDAGTLAYAGTLSSTQPAADAFGASSVVTVSGLVEGANEVYGWARNATTGLVSAVGAATHTTVTVTTPVPTAPVVSGVSASAPSASVDLTITASDDDAGTITYAATLSSTPPAAGAFGASNVVTVSGLVEGANEVYGWARNATTGLVSVVGAATHTTVTILPPYPNPGEPNETLDTATALTVGTPLLASITSASEHDYYKFDVPAGGATVHFQTFDQTGAACDPVYETVDTIVYVYDVSGTLVTWSDDTYNGIKFVSWCEDFTVPLPEGTNYVDIAGYPPVPFIYTLSVALAN